MTSRTRSIGLLRISRRVPQVLFGIGLDDLAGVRRGRRWRSPGVAVLRGEVEGLLDRLVEVDRLADLAARVGGVVPLVDRGALDLQEEALSLRFASSRSIAFCVMSASVGTLPSRARDCRCTSAGRLAGSPAGSPSGPVQRTGMLPSANRPSSGASWSALVDVVQFVCGADDPEAALLGLLLQRLALVVAGGRGLAERLGAAAQRDVGAGRRAAAR